MSKVIIVNDSRIMRLIIKKNIKEAGLVVDKFVDAGSGTLALDAIIQVDIDLVLYDWTLPTMSVSEFFNALKLLEITRKIPVIVVIVDSEKEIAKVKECKADGYITKPFETKQLREVLGKYLILKS